ncbi:MAG TPA: AAA family ATPase [Candidatus Obscuribacterales bacterium]
MKRLILLIGVPGSGKTTLAKKVQERGYHVLNADSIREELYGDPNTQGDPVQVFSIFFDRLEKAMSQGLDIIIDNTNINSKQRKPILDRAAKFGYSDVQLWLLDVPLQVCLDRNRARDRVVQEDIVSNMYAELTRNGQPRQSEGKVVKIRPGKDENDYRFFFQN